jgi:LuxR family glucitol operon transcriptional activator
MPKPPQPANTIEIFYSYSHKDKALRDELEIHLSALKRKGVITGWHDRDIDAGEDWAGEIDEHLTTSSVILLLVSPYFIDSDYCYEIEMTRALERHEAGEALVIPIILRPTDWRDLPFGRLQCLPTNAKPVVSWSNKDEAFFNVAQGIRKSIEAMNLAPTASPRDRASSDNLPPRFYGRLIGREKDLDRVMEGLDSQLPLITVEGFAGIGKTSLAIEIGYLCLHKSDIDVSGVVSFEYVVWISAKDKPDQKHWLNEVLNEIARVMGYFKITQRPPGELRQKELDLDRLLRTNKVLVIVDNFETTDDPYLIEWIQRMPEPSKVLITSRATKLRAAWAIDLKGLDDHEALRLIRQQAHALGLRFIESETDERLLSLVKVTAANPKALELALGHIKGGTLSLRQVTNQLYTNNPNKRMEQVFEYLHSQSWKLIGAEAQKLLLVAPLFVGVSLIRDDALQTASDLPPLEFDEALQRLLDWKLLEPNYDDQRYTIHPITREFARSKLNEDRKFEEDARVRWSRFYLEFLRGNIVREMPEEPYWNALVTDKMKIVDAEWPSIHEVIQWADRQKNDRLLLDLIMLLVHYMDSRLLNWERLMYVKAAIEAANRMGLKYDEALLRIDALGWTYVEENNPDEAYEQIMKGFDIAEKITDDGRDPNDLIALGYAWHARAMIEQGHSAGASRLSERALSIRCKPWIKSRVYMAAGDIALKEGDSLKALGYYENAKGENEKYGGEGHGYQIDPRIGLAYLGIGELDKAEEKFKVLRDHEQIAIGKLYAEYGIALVAYKRGDTSSARILANAVKEELSRRTKSNLLLNLINNLYEDLEAGIS